MPILKIAKIGHPVLYKKAKNVVGISKKEKQELKDLIINMGETLLDVDGIGLAAPQVYVSKKIIIFKKPKIQKENENQNKFFEDKISVLINPSYKNITNEYEDDWEGCLSIPGMIGNVRRFKKIRYQGIDLNGKKINKIVEGLHARIIQHECDHLDGILYISKLSHPNAFGFTEEVQKFLKND